MTSEEPSNIIQSKVLSGDTATEAEKFNNISLEEWSTTMIESKEESDRRLRVLRRLNMLMSSWIKHVMINVHHMSEKDAARYEGRIFTTGSYRYNVHTSGSDIDAVLIAPNLVTRDHFFRSFADRLAAEPLITEMTPVYTAKVPIIAMKFDGIDMDLSFGSIHQEKVPAMITDDLLRGLDEQSVRSANAVRVAHQLLEHAPAKYEFRTALRFIKQWAKVRGIHGSQYGFPTGIGWAILVCHVCQCYPRKNAAGILAAFFRVYKQWFTPDKTNPAIYLSEKRITSNEFGPSWNPDKKWDGLALLPVLTPVAPSTNACDMVKEHTLRILCREFARGHELITAATAAIGGGGSNKAITAAADTEPATPTPQPAFGVWSKILDPYPFFENHKIFLHIQVSCLSSAVERYKPYFDCVESRLNRLIASGKGIDKYPQVQIRPLPRRFEDSTQTAYVEETLRRQRTATVNNLAAAGGNADLSASPNNNATRTNLPPLVPPSKLLTGHIYIALDIDTTKKNAPPIDLREAIQVFTDAVTSDPNNYHQGITMPPQILMEGLKDVPLWIFDPSKSKVLKERAEEAVRAKEREAEEALKRKQEEEEAAARGEDITTGCGADDGDAEGMNSVVGAKRAREGNGSSADPRSPTMANTANLLTTNAAPLRPMGFAGMAGITAANPMQAGMMMAGRVGGAGAPSTAPMANPFLQMALPTMFASVVSSVPVVQAPQLTTDVDPDDELGMDF